MIDRNHIEKILQLNGLDVSSSDEEIKSVLISARWYENDVETALVVLHENNKNHSVRVNTMHNIFDKNSKLSPYAVNSILGLDIKVDAISETHSKSMRKTYNQQVISMIVISILFAVIILFLLMQFAGISIL